MYAPKNLASQVRTGNRKSEAQECFLNYCVTSPDAFIIFYTNDMIVKADSDAACLVASKAKSWPVGFMYMRNYEENEQIINDPIMVIVWILKMVVASVAEAEAGALHYTARKIVSLRMTVVELGHPKPATPIRTNNSTLQPMAS